MVGSCSIAVGIVPFMDCMKPHLSISPSCIPLAETTPSLLFIQLPHGPTVPSLLPFPAQGGPLLSSVQPANTLTRAVNEAMARSFLPNGRQPAQSANERRLETRNPFFHLPNVNQYFPKHSPRIMRNIPCPTSRGCVLSTTGVSLPQSIRIVRLCGGRRCLSDSFRRS